MFPVLYIVSMFSNSNKNNLRDGRSRDRMIVGFITTYAQCSEIKTSASQKHTRKIM
jgi:hypothetical protein